MPEVDVALPVSVPKISGDSIKDLLRFSFQGYAVWLEAEQFPSFLDTASPHKSDAQNNDLDQVIRTASQDLDVFPIPVPHMTMLYGITHLPEREVRKRFQYLALQFQEEEWPILQPEGFLSDIEINGLNGGEMVRSDIGSCGNSWCHCQLTRSPLLSTLQLIVEHGLDRDKFQDLRRIRAPYRSSF